MSTRNTIQKGGFVGAIARSNHVTPSQATPVPRTAATAAIARASRSICRTTCVRLAPIAVRMPTSRVLTAARASRRLATLAHAMRSTRETVASML
ncbi:MAG: hypothetical protein EXR91_10975 [Gemmatimonadetes bacterium]|nr:hypothetical protein [Gemmatimonadota bacterium]